jgi:type I pantothenate kinase
MSKKEQTLMTPYLHFNRSQWAALRDSVPMTLTEGEIARLKGINEDLSLEEVAEIYLPLSRLLNFYISSNLRRQAVLEQFLGRTVNAFLISSVLRAALPWVKAPPRASCRRC